MLGTVRVRCLAPGEVVQAVNGYAYTEAGLRWAASYTEPVTLSVLRGHRRLSFTMTPAPAEETVALQWEGSPASGGPHRKLARGGLQSAAARRILGGVLRDIPRSRIPNLRMTRTVPGVRC